MLCTSVAAQTFNDIDSLEQVWASGKSASFEEKMNLLLDLSFAYLYVDTAKCKMYAVEAVKFAQNNGSKLAEARAYVAMGNFYNTIFFSYQAHTYYVKAEKIFLELDDKVRLNIIYKNMMAMYFNIMDLDNAAYYANKVLTMAIELKDCVYLIFAERVLGTARFRDHHHQEALDYFLNLHQKALHAEDSLGLNRVISTYIGENCVLAYIALKRYQETLPYLYQSLAYSQLTGNTTETWRAYGALALTHAMMHNVDSAEYYIHKAKDSHIIINYRYQVYHASAIVDSLKGDYLSALANFQKYHHVSDSLSKEEKTTEMARLKVWHEFDQKELENSLLQQEYQKQRKMSLRLEIALVVILALLALVLFFYRKITETNREMKELHTVKDKLFSVVAHDLRSPMGALMSILKLATENRLDDETKAGLLKEVSSRVDNTFGLLDNLLRWAKSQMNGMVPAPAYFDVQEESRWVTTALQDVAAAKEVTLDNRIEPHQAYADRDMFAVVVRNLTSNAIKYTSAEGKVILASELANDKLIISVKDTGTGMPQEVQSKLFKLSETKSQRGTGNETGTGLGLVLCADFVKANGGSIWFTSVQGEGSTFFFSVAVKS